MDDFQAIIAAGLHQFDQKQLLWQHKKTLYLMKEVVLNILAHRCVFYTLYYNIINW